MKNKFGFLLFLAVAISGCSKHFVATGYRYHEQRLNANAPSDAKMISLIKPYKDTLDKEMNIVLAISDTILTKSVPESDLGNLMCDLVLKKSMDYSGVKVDFTFLNNGGIRLPNLPKGNITLGKVIELMPFENLIDIMTVNGKTLDTLFNYMGSKGGWQISGARYKFDEDHAFDIYIQGQALDLNKQYTIAVSDYLAQGGDNCTMLSHLPKTMLKQSLRDALIDGLKELNNNGEHVRSIIDGRVQKAD